MKWAVISLIFLTFSVAFGQDSPPAERVYRIGNGVSAPRVASKKEPEYSQEARRARVEGTVALSLVVDKDGMAKNITVAKRLGFGLDEKAVEAVEEWRFVPGQKDGNPVPVLATIQVNFRLLTAPVTGGWTALNTIYLWAPPVHCWKSPSFLPSLPPKRPAQLP